MADPFADSQEERRDQTKVHVRVQQRSGRKCITTVQGLADDLDLKRILKAFKKNFRCVFSPQWSRTAAVFRCRLGCSRVLMLCVCVFVCGGNDLLRTTRLLCSPSFPCLFSLRFGSQAILPHSALPAADGKQDSTNLDA